MGTSKWPSADVENEQRGLSEGGVAIRLQGLTQLCLNKPLHQKR